MTQLYRRGCWMFDCAAARATRNFKEIWEELRRHPGRQRTTTPQIPVGYNEMPNIYPKIAHSFPRSPLPSNTLIRRPTPLTILNDIQIQSAVLPQYTFPRHRQTDTCDKRQVYSKSRLRLTVSDAANDSRSWRWWTVRGMHTDHCRLLVNVSESKLNWKSLEWWNECTLTSCR